MMIDLGKHFVALGHTVDLVVLNETNDTTQFVPTTFNLHLLQTGKVRNASLAISRYICAERPDAIIANIWPLTIMAALAIKRVKRSWRPRSILVEHAMLSHQYAGWGWSTKALLRASLSWSIRACDACIAVSASVASDLSRLAMISSQKIMVINNPVPAPLAATKEELALAEKAWGRGRRILSVGRLKRVKNHELLIDAFNEFRKEGDRLLIVGEGELLPLLEAKVSNLNLDDSVVLMGFQNPLAFYETADLFVLSSNSEGFGNVLVEAMHAGLPIVSTDCPGGPAHILNGGEFGALVPLGDVSALSQAMEHSLRNRRPADVLKNRAKEFSVKKAADAYLSLAFPSDGV